MSLQENPYKSWQCAFNFDDSRVPNPEPIPENKGAFIEAINAELKAIANIRGGFESYIRALKSGEYHVFTEEFLKHEENATSKTIDQLIQIADDLQRIATATICCSIVSTTIPAIPNSIDLDMKKEDVIVDIVSIDSDNESILTNGSNMTPPNGLAEWETVDPDLLSAFKFAQPWILRSRAILVSCHVYYKINYVLGSDKKKW